MHIHAINLPRFVIVGPNVIPQVGEVLRRLNFKGGLLLACGESYSKDPAAKVEKIVRKLNIPAHGYCVKDASVSTVDELGRVIAETESGMVVSVGGGKTIDVAKMASFRQGIPFMSIPTSAAHDGIASPIAALKDTNGSMSKMAHPPVALLADTEIIANSPKRYLVSGVGDIIAKYTAVRDWSLAHRLRGEYYGEYAASLALMSAELITENIDLIARGFDEGIRSLIEGLISCGYAMCIAGSSRPCSGSEHLFSHALDKICAGQALHGEKCGVGAIMMMYLHGGDWKVIKEVLFKVGAPTTAKELGIKDKDIIEALTIAHTIRPDRYTILGESGITRDAAENVARITGVVE
jgi:glycerol-1-phosphate dehydrogenase [NAD(P)+]